VPLDMLLNLYLVTRHSGHVNLRLLSRSILPIMGIGVLAGILTFQFVQGLILKRIFGLLVILLSARELNRLVRKRPDQKTLSGLTAAVYTAVAGFVHGIYASGGPLLIYALGKLNLSKSVFRSTLAAVWLFFSIILTGSYLIAGEFSRESLRLIAILLPVIIVGLLLGEWLHHHIDEYRFRIFVFSVLLFAGISICVG
jgi:uncharacterized membrane protein YfcA